MSGAWALLLLLAGCYNPSIADGQYTCPDSICPSGYSCNPCQVCVKQSELASDGGGGPACTTCATAIACELLCSLKDTSCLNACHDGLTSTGSADIDAVESCLKTTCAADCADLARVMQCKSCPTTSVRSGGACNSQYNTCLMH